MLEARAEEQEWEVLLASAASASKAEDFERAIQLYDGFIERKPTHAEAFYKRAIAFNALGRLELALADYDRAIALNPRYGYAFCNRGSVLERMDRKEEALDSYDVAVSINPDDFLAHYNRGTVLRQLHRRQEALTSLDKSILLKRDYAEAYVNRGNVLQELWRHEDAIASYDKAIQLKPIFAEAFQGRGTSLYQLKRLEAAIESFGQALALNPQQKFIPGMRRYVQMQICDWSDLEKDLQRLALATKEGVPVCPPFAMLALIDEPPLHRSAAALWARNENSSSDALGPINRQGHGKKLRIGYFSADFRNHPVAQLTAELFERHNRDRFEITAFAFGPLSNDAMRARLERCFDRFADVRDKSDAEVAALARRLEIDIAVDLGGFTEHARTKIFSLRAAPIQINYLGYPGTMGADFIDYLIADRIVVPESQQSYYAEKIVYLPNCYLPSDSTRPPSAIRCSRQQFELPKDAFVFCCFNNVYKITPCTFGAWMRIMNRVEGSVLWLAQTNPVAANNLRREAARQGIAAERLIFANRIECLADHRARLGHADLFLDTFPYNAHATALDALWAGLPIITRLGESFASRVAASLLTEVGLQELIAITLKQYEEVAVELAANPSRIAEIRAKLLRNRAATPSFDMRRFTANLEGAYTSVFERYLRGEPPDHIHLES